MSAQKVLVTGSEGYIGQHLVELLVEAGHEVTGCDLCWYDEAFVLPRRDGYLLTRQDFGDLERKDLLPFDAVCHLAAISNDPMGDLDPQVTLDVNKWIYVELEKTNQLARKHISNFRFDEAAKKTDIEMKSIHDYQKLLTSKLI